MRIVFSSRPAFGHVFAIAPLAAAARAAGHELIFASGEGFLPRLQSWGFETRKVGEPIEWGFQRAAAEFPHLLQPEQPEFGARMFVDVLGPRSRDDMTAVIEETRPDVVVYEATDVGAGLAAALAGVPAVCHSLSVWVDVFMDAIRARMDALCAEMGVEVPLDIAVGDALLDIWPPSMQAAGAAEIGDRRWLLRPVTWAEESADVPAWIESAQGPVVFVSLGTYFWGKELLTRVIAALAEIDCDALVLTGVDATPDDFPNVSERVHLSGFVNQAAVLQRADVVVHHGGAGTTLGSLARGLPALVVGDGADRPYTGEALSKSGAGLRLEPDDATPEAIAGALRSLLGEPIYRQRAAEIKDEIAGMPSPEDVVARLEALAG